MPRFTLHRAPGGTGMVVDVQSDLLDVLTTRVVVPLLPAELAPRPAAILNPVFILGETPHVLVTQFLAAVPRSVLGPPHGSLAAEADRITRALDFLYQGF